MSENPQTPTRTSVSVAEAMDAILSNFAPLEPTTVPLEASLGLVLAEDIYSDIDLPPFDNSAMDGYAVRAEDTTDASLEEPAGLRVKGYIPAGAFPGPDDRVEQGTAYRIMTGAPVPPGADAVVRFEDTNEGRALNTPGLQPASARATPVQVGSDVLIYVPVKPGDSMRPTGEDVRE